MLDLETMSTRPHAAIVSIGAYAWQPETGEQPAWQPTFARNVDLGSCIRAGLHVDGDTVYWWLRQSDAARAALVNPQPEDVKDVMRAFLQWTARHLGRDGNLWSHGSNFDEVIVREIAAMGGLPTPWHYSRVRDTRTLFAEAGYRMPRTDDRGSGHQALADAEAQARSVTEALAILRARNAG